VRETVRAYLPAVFSGILLTLSFPTFNLYPLAWVALVPFMVSVWGKEPSKAFIAGLVFGVFYFFGTTYWIYHSISHYGGIPLIVSLLIVFSLCLYLSLYPGVFAVLFSLKIRSTKLPALLLAPVLWVSLEYARSYVFTGFPWSSIGYSQYLFLYGIQSADLTGIYGISFLVVSCNGVISDIFIARKRHAEIPLFPARLPHIGIAAFLLLFLLNLFYGYWRLHEYRPGNTIKIGIVQGNIDQSKKWEPSHQEEVISIYKELTRQIVTSSPHLIIWPETSLPFFFGYDTIRSQDLVAFQRQLNTYLLFGTVMVKNPPGKETPLQLLNSAVLLDRNGNITYSYYKIHLVPFGEYVPLKSIFFFVEKFVSGAGEFVPGDSFVKAQTPFGTFSAFICYEIIFPGLVRKFYSKGGDFIVTITNDAWFGQTSGPYQHFSMAVFRAIENRKPLVRVANTGVSGFMDSNGRILKKTPLFTQRIETGEITLDRSRSVYSRFGDIFSYLCIAAALIVLI
jgi:apolipoprotein N-acyltransferase